MTYANQIMASSGVEYLQDSTSTTILNKHTLDQWFGIPGNYGGLVKFIGSRPHKHISSDPQDVTHDFYVNMCNKIMSRDNPLFIQKLSPYLYSCAKKWLIDQYRTHKRSRGINEALPNDGTDLAEAIPSNSVDQLATLLEAEKNERLLEAWANLAPMQIVYINARLNGMSNIAIALIYGISEGGVKGQVSKGVARLKQAIR
jgi:RNA polymerase sigma factor (sigma-70 family)